MTLPIQPVSALDPGLVGSLRAMNVPNAAAQSKFDFAQALLGMYPEGADAIVHAIYPQLAGLAEQDLEDNQFNSGPGSMDEFWSKLLVLPAMTPQVERVKQTAQQLFLEGVSGPKDALMLGAFLGKHGSGKHAKENWQAIAQLAERLGDTRPDIQAALRRNEAVHIARAVQSGDDRLIAVVIGDQPGRVMGGVPHGSFMLQWTMGARRATTPDRAEHTLLALLKAGVSIDAPDQDGRSALEWLLDPISVLAQDTYLAGLRAGKTMMAASMIHSSEAQSAALERSAPVVAMLLSHGARWEHLTDLDPRAQALLDAHPVVRRAGLMVQVDESQAPSVAHGAATKAPRSM